jgi:hypothetical protein
MLLSIHYRRGPEATAIVDSTWLSLRPMRIAPSLVRSDLGERPFNGLTLQRLPIQPIFREAPHGAGSPVARHRSRVQPRLLARGCDQLRVRIDRAGMRRGSSDECPHPHGRLILSPVISIHLTQGREAAESVIGVNRRAVASDPDPSRSGARFRGESRPLPSCVLRAENRHLVSFSAQSPVRVLVPVVRSGWLQHSYADGSARRCPPPASPAGRGTGPGSSGRSRSRRSG